MQRQWTRAVWVIVAAAFVIGASAPEASAQRRQRATPPAGPVEPTGNDLKLETGWKQVEVVGGLDRPWGVVWLPAAAGEPAMLITERRGRLRVVEGGKLRDEPVAGLPGSLLAHGQGGLMDISLHPEFAANRFVYLTMTTGTKDANRTELFRGVLSEDLNELTDVESLFRVSRTKQGGQHFGSRLVWLADGTLVMSIGDGGNPPASLDGEHIRNKAQDRSLHFGKTVRMTADGKPAPDNPFAGDDDPATDPYVYTYGHRNIQGMAIQPGTQRLWASEHGARGGDELNLLAAGNNYGWPLVTYSIEYWGPRISNEASRPGMVDPVHVWTPCVAPSALAFYTGDEFPEWRGDALTASLVLRQVRRTDFDADGEIAGETTLQFKQRIRWVGNGPGDGSGSGSGGGLYVLTDEKDGGLYRIEPVSDSEPMDDSQ